MPTPYCTTIAILYYLANANASAILYYLANANANAHCACSIANATLQMQN
jgi:hypothetical protein